ncbi:MAG: HD domain-containing protein [Candidatus Riflebacteria bacterium]|nr:HD domain-containing protein [Candidatus Riflebacteria bacterium]
MFTRRLDQAFSLAHELHQRQYRKGTRIPYVAHLMAVAALVAEGGGTEEQVIAALLHDAVEDQGGEETARRIAREFGPEVARIVESTSDSTVADPAAKASWKERKVEHLRHLRAAPPDVRLVCAADKVHNARSIVAELLVHGAGALERFKGKVDGTLWYYAEAARVLGEGWEHPLLGELEQLVAKMRSLAEFHRTAGVSGDTPLPCPGRPLDPEPAPGSSGSGC